MSLSELRERFEKTKKKLLLSLLKQIREDSDDPFLSGLSQKELLSQLLNDICALGPFFPPLSPFPLSFLSFLPFLFFFNC